MHRCSSIRLVKIFNQVLFKKIFIVGIVFKKYETAQYLYKIYKTVMLHFVYNNENLFFVVVVVVVVHYKGDKDFGK